MPSRYWVRKLGCIPLCPNSSGYTGGVQSPHGAGGAARKRESQQADLNQLADTALSRCYTFPPP